MHIEVNGILGFILLILDVYAIVRTLQSSASVSSKVIWVILVLLMPVLGFILWLLFGPGDREPGR